MTTDHPSQVPAEIGVNVPGSITAERVDIHDIHVGETVYQLPEAPPYVPPARPAADAAPPAPGPLPPGSRMPLPRNAQFTGRAGDLQALARGLLPGAGRAVVTGWGGVGKTQLAAEYVHRYGRYYAGGVYWLNAGNAALLEDEVAACGVALGLRPWPEKRPEQVAAVVRAWQGPAARLVVLDNLEEIGLARAWLAQLGGGTRVLATARREVWPADLGLAQAVLGALPRGESAALLRGLAPRLAQAADGELDALAARLGDLPLALDLAGRYLGARPGLGVEAYLAELAAAGALAHTAFVDWTAGEESPTGHLTSLATTFLVSWARLAGDAAPQGWAARLVRVLRRQTGGASDDRLAARLFRAAAWCAPNAVIPRAAFYRLAAGEEAAADRALRRLGELGLARVTDDGALVHPLLAEYGRGLAGAGAPLAEVAAALAGLAREANDEMDRTGVFWPHESLWPHVRAAATAMDTSKEAATETARLWNSLGYHLRRLADLAGVRAAYERALAIDERVYGPDHPNVATCVNNLGSALQDQGDLAGAGAAYERALAIAERVYGLDHPEVTIPVNNLGSVLQAQGDLAGARAAYERALAIAKRAYGPDHPNVATCINNLGRVLRAQGDLAGARVAYERALAIDERVYGPDHPDVARDVNNLGGVLRDQGNLAGACAAFERALAILERRLPPDHPYIRIARENLAAVAEEDGQRVPGIEASAGPVREA